MEDDILTRALTLANDVESIPIDRINVLIQERKTFHKETLIEFSKSIDRNGILHPILVACVDEVTAREHIARLNRLWNVNIKFSDLVSYKKKYLILIAGERRLRAAKLIVNGDPKVYSKIFFKKGTIRASVYRKISTEDIIVLQGAENDYLNPPPAEVAAHYNKFYRELKDVRGTLSVTEFAKMVGRSEGLIYRAIRFAELPLLIQNMVSKGSLQFGIACELARLHQAKFSTDKLIFWASKAVIMNLSVRVFTETVNSLLESARGLSMFSENEDLKLVTQRDTKNLNMLLDKNMMLQLDGGIAFIKRVLGLFSDKLIGYSSSPFLTEPIYDKLKLFSKLLRHDIYTHLSELDQEVGKDLLLELKKLEDASALPIESK